MIEFAKRCYRKLFRDVPKVRRDVRLKCERHGSSYGGWFIKSNSLNSSSIVLSAGLGKDISFDKSIIEKYGCNIHGFDPTPNVDVFVEKQDLKGFIYYNYGLSNVEQIMKFYKPRNDGDISHSTKPNGNAEFIELRCVDIRQAIKMIGAKKIDLFKMDIEGSEYDVIDFFTKNIDILPRQILVEFHHFMDSHTNEDTIKAINKLRGLGYKLFKISDSFCEYSLILDDE